MTGSGRPNLLHAAQQALAAGRQALVLVPEINLTPQLRRASRPVLRTPVVSLHSALTPAQRLRNWLLGIWAGRLVLGTRLAIFASLRARVDRRRRGTRPVSSSRRARAIRRATWRCWRARHEGVPVVLGSATPSLESWQRVRAGGYTGWRSIGASVAARCRRLRHRHGPRAPDPAGGERALAPALLARCRRAGARRAEPAAAEPPRLRAGAALAACGWKSGCPHCSAWRVFHKIDRTLRCPIAPRASRCRCVPRLRQFGHRGDRARNRKAAGATGAATAQRTHRSHRRRQHPRRRPAGAAAPGGARRRRRRAGRHADGRQGTRFPPRHAGGCGQPRRRLVQQRLPRPRALVCPADAGCGTRRARRCAHAAQSEMWIQTWHPLTRCMRRWRRTTTRHSPRRSRRTAQRRAAAVCRAGACCAADARSATSPPASSPRPRNWRTAATASPLYPVVPPPLARVPTSSACRCSSIAIAQRAAADARRLAAATAHAARRTQRGAALGRRRRSAGDLTTRGTTPETGLVVTRHRAHRAGRRRRGAGCRFGFAVSLAGLPTGVRRHPASTRCSWIASARSPHRWCRCRRGRRSCAPPSSSGAAAGRSSPGVRRRCERSAWQRRRGRTPHRCDPHRPARCSAPGAAAGVGVPRQRARRPRTRSHRRRRPSARPARSQHFDLQVDAVEQRARQPAW